MTRSEGSSNEQRSERRVETVEAVSTENAEATA
jgi:hypothetical protein